MRAYYLYQLTLPDGQQYLGVTKDVRRRFCRHCCNLRTLLGREIQRQGAPTLRVLVAGHRDFIYELEAKAIAAFNTRVPNGLNVSAGGYGCRDPLPSTRAKIAASHIGLRHTPASIEKMSAAQRGKKLSSVACANISRGLWTRLPEVRIRAAQKTSAKLLGRQFSPSRKAKLSFMRKGRPWSIARHRVGQEALRGRKRPEYVVKKVSAALTGRSLSSEHRANISAARNGKSGKLHSPEARTKISRSIQSWWDRRRDQANV